MGYVPLFVTVKLPERETDNSLSSCAMIKSARRSDTALALYCYF
jgi:hypothetical protein